MASPASRQGFGLAGRAEPDARRNAYLPDEPPKLHLPELRHLISLAVISNPSRRPSVTTLEIS